MTRTHAIVSPMAKPPDKLREATTREGMRSVNVWLPHRVHQALALLRVNEGIAINEAVRLAVLDWLKHRRQPRGGTK